MRKEGKGRVGVCGEGKGRVKGSEERVREESGDAKRGYGESQGVRREGKGRARGCEERVREESGDAKRG